MFIVEESVELKDADEIKAALLTAIEAHEAGEFTLDLSGTVPTQVALQLSLAGLKELETRGIEPLPGFALSFVLEQQISEKMAG